MTIAQQTKSRKHRSIAKAPLRKPNELFVPQVDGKSQERTIAEAAMASEARNAFTAQTFLKGAFGEIDITETICILKEKVSVTQGGDLAEVEAMLTAQAIALDTIFGEMARRAALNLGQHLSATDIYMRLALKAQNQARATLRAIAEIKNPRHVSFVKQANIAHGPQQVNNSSELNPESPSKLKISEADNSRLLEHDTDGEWLDTGAASKTGRRDTEMAALGEVNRT